MKLAPALAASSAWLAEKHRVTLTIVPSSVSALQVLRPSGVSGTLIAILSAIFRSTSASLHHRRMVERDDFGRDRAGADAGDLAHHLDEIAARFLDQRGVGGDPVEQPAVGELADVGDVGGVGEEFHGDLSLRLARICAADSRYGP